MLMLKSDIDINAKVIWHLLISEGALSVRQIGELTDFKEIMIILSLGWLSKENKIRFFEKGEAIYIEQNQAISELYF